LTSAHSDKVYRILRKAFAHSPLDGEGAYLYGGRWSSPGTRLVYTSEYQSLAMLEYFVHVDADNAPSDLVLVTVDIPNKHAKSRILAAQMPADWRTSPAPPELANFGDEFVRKTKACILVVPSVLAPGENNWLLNPYHPDFLKVTVSSVEPLKYDLRMFKPRRRRRKS
jgi:RES domain-containing protein